MIIPSAPRETFPVKTAKVKMAIESMKSPTNISRCHDVLHVELGPV